MRKVVLGPALGSLGLGLALVLVALVAAPASWVYPVGVVLVASGLVGLLWRRPTPFLPRLVGVGVVVAVGAVALWWPAQDVADLQPVDVSPGAGVLAQHEGLTYVQEDRALVVLDREGDVTSRIDLAPYAVGPRGSTTISKDWIVRSGDEYDDITVLTAAGQPAWTRETSRRASDRPETHEVVAADDSVVVVLVCAQRCRVDAVGADGEVRWSETLPEGSWFPVRGPDVENDAHVLPDQVWVRQFEGETRSYTMSGERGTTWDTEAVEVLPASWGEAPTVLLEQGEEGVCTARGLRDGRELWSGRLTADACLEQALAGSWTKLVRLAGGAITVAREDGAVTTVGVGGEDTRVGGTNAFTIVVGDDEGRAWVLDGAGEVVRTAHATAGGRVAFGRGESELATVTEVRSVNPYVPRTRAGADDPGGVLHTGVRRLAIGGADPTECLLPDGVSVLAVLTDSTALVRTSDDGEESPLSVARCGS